MGTVLNCRIPNPVSANLVLSQRRADGVMYSLEGRTDVGLDVVQNPGTPSITLTVNPGVTVFGGTLDSSIVVNRGSLLRADGQEVQPIIFTALANLTGSGLTEATDNLWGGIIINGRAPVSDCQGGPSSTGGDVGCWRLDEGISPNTYGGGATPADNSGILRYVQVNFTGVGSGGNEIQGITTVGVGSATVFSYLQVHNSKDDGIEIFGGTHNADHLVFTGISDDSLDTDVGWIGGVQFMLAVRRAAGSNGDDPFAENVLEIDSSSNPNNVPRQKFKLANFTLVQNTPSEPAIRLRGGADAIFANGIVVAPVGDTQGCLDVDNDETVQTTGPDESGLPRFHSVVFDCQLLIDADADTLEATALGNVANTNVDQNFSETLLLLNGASGGYEFANGVNETNYTPYASLTSIAPFVAANYIGAFQSPSNPWTAGWTCNSDVADLRGATRCIDIRIS